MSNILSSLVILTMITMRRVLRTRPKDWAAAINDDTIGASARNAFVHGELNEETVGQLENHIVSRSVELAKQFTAEDVVVETRQLVSADEIIDVRDPEGNFPAVCRRWSDQIPSELHILSCEILSNTPFGFSPERFHGIMEFRKSFPRRTEFGCDQEGYMGGKAIRAIRNNLCEDSLGNSLVIAPIGNLDYRLRKYAWRNVTITGHARMRCIITAPPYEFTSDVKDCFEKHVLLEQFHLNPAEARQLGTKPMCKFLKEGGTEPVYHACHAYHNACISGTCDYWGEFDLIGSGIVNGWWQLRDKRALTAADYSLPDWQHPRSLFAEKLSTMISLFATFEPDEELYQKFLKLILSPLQYGAGAPGVFFALTGVKYDEDEEVDWELFRDVNVLLKAWYGDLSPRDFSDEVFALSGNIASCYASCFPELKDAEECVGDAFQGSLEAGIIPEFTSFSGGKMLGPVIKRLSTTHVCRGVDNKAVGSRTKDVWVSDKVVDPEKLRSAAFSWILHNIDAEIISLLVVRLHAAGVPCFTNHDAVFIPLWAYDIMQRLFAECIAEVNSHNILVDQFGCRPSSKNELAFGANPCVAT